MTFRKMASNNKNIIMKADPLALKPKDCLDKINEKGERFKMLKELSNKDVLKERENKIRFVCISDTHSKHDHVSIPHGDVLVHSGDFTMLSQEQEITKFNEFLEKQKDVFKHIIVVCGNHEMSFDEGTWNKSSLVLTAIKTYFLQSPFAKFQNPTTSRNMLTNCTYLQDQLIEIEGIKIYGSPWQPPHFDLAFNLKRGDIMEKWNQIPTETDILITHGPPLGIGDKTKKGDHVGCADLLSSVQDRIKPKFHLYGHIHESHGIWNDGVTTYINSSICNCSYDPVQSPIVFDYVIK